MSTVHQRVLELKAVRELMPYDYISGTGLRNDVNGKRKEYYQNDISAPSLLNNSFHRPLVDKVLGCKSERDTHKVLRREPVSSASGIYPPTGYARHQEKGLAYLRGKPIDGVIAPISSSFYAGLNNKLGTPLG
tara:strand:+ start:285 stop:683 length:399 start_codon:yes stop_codon:yes gene_type:complete